MIKPRFFDCMTEAVFFEISKSAYKEAKMRKKADFSNGRQVHPKTALIGRN